MDNAKLNALIDHINHAHDAKYALVGRATSGESGAYLIAGRSGLKSILKFGRGAEFKPQSAADVTHLLRGLGYPAPRYICVGTYDGERYAVQELMPGTLLRDRELTPRILEQLIGINRMQRGQASAAGDVWMAELRRSVIAGLGDYCRIDAMQTHSARSAELLALLQRIVVENQNAFCATDDIVHWDFHSGNILVEGNRVTGVIDWDGLRAGDASFDLATLLFYLYPHREARDVLRDEALAHSNAGAIKVYLAHIIVRQLDWSIRSHAGETLQYFSQIADEVVRDFIS